MGMIYTKKWQRKKKKEKTKEEHLDHFDSKMNGSRDRWNSSSNDVRAKQIKKREDRKK